MQSANIASLHFFSSDPEKEMDYVHGNKGESAPGTVYLFDENFDQIYSGKVDGLNDGSELGKYIDLDSFARYFLVNEWLANNDVWTSSTFVYKPKGDDVIYAGPVWDFDSSMRVRERPGIR